MAQDLGSRSTRFSENAYQVKACHKEVHQVEPAVHQSYTAQLWKGRPSQPDLRNQQGIARGLAIPASLTEMVVSPSAAGEKSSRPRG